MEFKLEQLEGATLYFYNRVNLPWPLKDSCYILKMDRNPENYSSHWPQFIGNTVVNNGSWELSSLDGRIQKTFAIYTLYTYPRIYVPYTLERLALKSTLPGIIRAIRKRVLKLILEERKKNARLQFRDCP